jgi:thiopeptide-type bacteriocin biosynthesis protein
VTNQNVIIGSSQISLPYADIYGQGNNDSIYVNATPAVRFTLEQASTPVPYVELIQALQQHYPQVPEAQIHYLLQQLWENHFLLSNLRPPLTDVSPTQYVLRNLPDVQVLSPVRQLLMQILSKAEQFDNSDGQQSIALLQDIHRDQEAIEGVSSDTKLQTDTSLNLASSTLNTTLGEVASQAAQMLLRLSKLHGLPHLQEYRLAFLEKYGPYAEVPLLELLDPGKGLGAPPTYQYPPRQFPLSTHVTSPSSTIRDQTLASLVNEAINSHAHEIQLTEEVMEKLEVMPIKATDVPLSLEIYLQIQARSQEALQRNEWKAVIGPNCGSPSGGRTFGRFFDILGSESEQAIHAFTRQEEQLAPDVIFAELVYLPTRARTANVAIRPAVRRYEIVVGTTPLVHQEYVIGLDDLVVGIRDNHFYLRSLKLGKEVRVCEGHMLVSTNAPNICRFLAELSRDGRPLLMSFDWGFMNKSPFLPRVIVGDRLILSPAQWNVLPSMLEPAHLRSSDGEKLRAIRCWREAWRVPRHVYWTYADNRLLLDLEHPCMIDELFQELEHSKHEPINLQEMCPDFEHLWLGDGQFGHRYVAEIVVPLLRTLPETQQKLLPQFQPVASILRNKFPGDEWVYLKLYCDINAQNNLIARHFSTLLHECRAKNLIDQWFFIRFLDSEAHLRLRLHASSLEVAQPLLLQSLTWAQQLAHDGIIQKYVVDTYEREVERYGGVDNIATLERFFAIDSELTQLLIKELCIPQAKYDVAEIAIQSLDFLFSCWGFDSEYKRKCIVNQTELALYKEEFHSKRRRLCELLIPWEHTHDLIVSQQREHLLSLLTPYQAAIQPIASSIRAQEEAGQLWGNVPDLLASLAHMHVNRLIGINRQTERRIYSLWLLTLESLQSRQKAEKLSQSPKI